MRRRLPAPIAVLAALTALPVLVVVPTVSLPAAAPHPVRSTLTTLVVDGVDPAASGSAATGSSATGSAAAARIVTQRALSRPPVVLTAPRTTAPFTLVALTWDGALPSGTRLQVRVREHGGWTGWNTLTPTDDGPDGKAADAVLAGRAVAAKTIQRNASGPLLTDGADGLQVRVDSTSGTKPSGLHAQLIDAGTSLADAPSAPAASAVADTTRPAIVTRAQWGADESLVKGSPTINPTVKALFLHHTDTTNSYTAAQAYAQVRAVYAFHTKVRGWNDLGYNFLVDRYGRVFEGRKGSLTDAVQGAHTAGFNEQTLGISVLGTFSTAKAPAATIDSLVDVMSWKAAAYGIDPRSSTTLVATSGSNKYPEGRAVSMRTISGHRDGYLTECPGNALYPMLGSLRAAVTVRMRPGLVSPTVSAATALQAGLDGGSGGPGSVITFSAVFPTVQRWWLSITPMCSDGAVRVLSGRTAGRISAPWDLLDSGGAPVPPGVYRLTMITSSPVGTAPTWTRDVEVLPGPGGVAGSCPVVRLSGPDVFAGAVVAGRAAYPDAQSVVLVGAGARLDAVVAAPLSRVKGAPLLLTPAGALPDVVAQDISGHGVSTVWIVGGPASVSPAVEQQLRSLGVSTVTRLTGSDRYSSAAAVAREVGARASAAVVVSGDSARLWDGVAAAGPAAATGRPVLLVTAAGVPPATAAALKALRVTNVAVVGSAQAVPSGVIARLGASGVTSRVRITGADRYATALAVDKAFTRPVPADRVVVAPASNAGLVWATLAAAQGRLTVLTDPGGVPASGAAWLTARKPGSVAVVADPGNAGTAVLRQVYALTR